MLSLQPDRGADPGRALPRVLAHAGRCAPHRPRPGCASNRLVGAITIPSLLGLIVVAPGLRPRRPRRKWGAGGAGRPDPLLGRPAAVAPAPELEHPAGRDRTDAALPLLRGRAVREPDRIRRSGCHWGIVGVAAGYAISSTSSSRTTPGSHAEWSTRRCGSSAALSRIAQAAAVMAVVVSRKPVRPPARGTNGVERLLTLIAIGAAVYIPVCTSRPRSLGRGQSSPAAQARARALMAGNLRDRTTTQRETT